jgi:hypothetical protein
MISKLLKILIVSLAGYYISLIPKIMLVDSSTYDGLLLYHRITYAGLLFTIFFYSWILFNYIQLRKNWQAKIFAGVILLFEIYTFCEYVIRSAWVHYNFSVHQPLIDWQFAWLFLGFFMLISVYYIWLVHGFIHMKNTVPYKARGTQLIYFPPVNALGLLAFIVKRKAHCFIHTNGVMFGFAAQSKMLEERPVDLKRLGKAKIKDIKYIPIDVIKKYEGQRFHWLKFNCLTFLLLLQGKK